MFQHTAARRRLPRITALRARLAEFQHTAARRRLPKSLDDGYSAVKAFQHTAARRRLRNRLRRLSPALRVSTHSRPKAAAGKHPCAKRKRGCFNTQPPEGGCDQSQPVWPHEHRFNTQPPEGGCKGSAYRNGVRPVSTHSRPKAAAPADPGTLRRDTCFNTQPPEGGCVRVSGRVVCNHWFQHTAARRRLPGGSGNS